MGLMDKMMERMILIMPTEEKEALMLKMMPMMMAGMDPIAVLPDMLITMGEMTTLTDIYSGIAAAAKDEELKSEGKLLLDELKVLLPNVMTMMPMMMEAMKATGLRNRMLDVMSSMMPTMMPVMREIMPTMMNDTIPSVMAKDDNVRQMMAEMMMDLMPTCIETMLPDVEAEKQQAFVAHLSESMDKAGLNDERTPG